MIVLDNCEIVSSTFGDNTFNGGNISLNANGIVLKNGATLESKTSSQGNGGFVSIQAKDAITFSGINDEGYASSIATYSLGQSDKSGNAGNIKLTSSKIIFKDGGHIIASTKGFGLAGEINVNAHQSITISGKNPNAKDEHTKYSGIISQSEGQDEMSGDGGRIDIQTGFLKMENHGKISTASKGSGHAGNINIKAQDIFLISSANISSASKSPEKGGAAGRLNINASHSIQLINSSLTTEAVKTITTDDQTDHLNGKITIQANYMISLQKSVITSSVLSERGNGGDIDIDPTFVLMNKSKIIANAYEGDGGNIHIVADHFIQSSDSLVDASSKFGVDGDINIDAPDEQIEKGIAKLPDNFFNAQKWLNTPCALRDKENVSRLIISGRDAIPDVPDDLRPSLPLDMTGLKYPKGLSNHMISKIEKGQNHETNGQFRMAAQTWKYCLIELSEKKFNNFRLFVIDHLAYAYQKLGFHDQAIELFNRSNEKYVR